MQEPAKTAKPGFAAPPSVLFDLVFGAYAVLYETALKPLIMGINIGPGDSISPNIPLAVLVLSAIVLETFGIRMAARDIRSAAAENPDKKEKTDFGFAGNTLMSVFTGAMLITLVYLLSRWKGGLLRTWQEIWPVIAVIMSGITLFMAVWLVWGLLRRKRRTGVPYLVRLGRSMVSLVLFFVCAGLVFGNSLNVWLLMLLLFVLVMIKEGAVTFFIDNMNVPLPENAARKPHNPVLRFLGHFTLLFYACTAFTVAWDLFMVKYYLNSMILDISNPLEVLFLACGGVAGAFLFIIPIRMGYLLQGFRPGMTLRDRALHWTAFVLAILAAFYPLAKVYNAPDFYARGEKNLMTVSSRDDAIYALKDFNNAVRLDAGKPDYLIGRATALLMLGSNSAAGADLTNAARLEGSASRLQYAMACWYFTTGRTKESDDGFGGAVRGGLTNAELHFARGQSFYCLGMYGLASRLADIALHFGPGDPRYHDLKGKSLHGAGQYRKALSCFARALELDPSCAEYHYDRAWCRLDLADLEGAAKDFSGAIALDRRDGRYYSGRGTAYYRLGMTNQARDDWRKGAGLYDAVCRTNLLEHFGETYVSETED